MLRSFAISCCNESVASCDRPQPGEAHLAKSVPYERRFQGFGSYRLNKRAIVNFTYIQPAP